MRECKNCGHEIVQAKERYRYNRWFHLVKFKGGRENKRNLCLAPCKCRKPEPKGED